MRGGAWFWETPAIESSTTPVPKPFSILSSIYALFSSNQTTQPVVTPTQSESAVAPAVASTTGQSVTGVGGKRRRQKSSKK